MNNIAIIIPYYKLTFFRETLESLAAQTDQRFTVYIGNDASPENPEELLKEFEGKFKYVYKKFDRNLGGISLTKQWDRCMKMTQGEEWFMIFGDDDYLDSNCIQGFYYTVKNNVNDNSVLRYKFQVKDERVQKTSDIFDFENEEKSTDFIVRRARGTVRSSLSEYVFRSIDFKKHGIVAYPKAFYSDNMMVLLYSNFGGIQKISNGTVFIRISSESITGNKKNTQDLKSAGCIFYKDLLTKYPHKFDQNQKRIFLIHLFDCFLEQGNIFKAPGIFKIIFKNSDFQHSVHYFFLYLKTVSFVFLKKLKIEAISVEKKSST